MKFLAVLLTFCIGCCLAKLDQQQLETMNGFTKACLEQLNILADQNFVAQVMQKKDAVYSDQEIDFMVCMARKYGILTQEGRYNTQLVKEIFFKSNTFDKQLVEEVVDLCYDEPKGTNVRENVLEANKCFFANKKFNLF